MIKTKKQVSREGAKGARKKQTIGRGLTQIKHR